MGALCAKDGKNAEQIEEVPTEKLAPGEPEEGTPEVGEPRLVISIVGAQGVRNSDWMPGTGGKPDCYCEVTAGGQTLHTTAVLTDVLEPVWQEECKVASIAEGAALEFSVYDKDFVGSDFLGKAVLEAKDYAEAGFNGFLKLADAKAPEAYIRVKVKVAGKDLPPGPPPQFTVTVEKPTKDASFGLALDTKDGQTLQVLELKEGPFSTYNASVSPSLQVKKGDIFVSANGMAGKTDDMLKQFVEEMKVECVVVRPISITILFDRGAAGSALGLEYPDKAGGEVLVVKSIEAGGAVEASNAAAKEQDKLLPCDRITAVNGQKGAAEKLQKLLEETSGKIQLTVSRRAIAPKSDEGEDGLKGLVHWLFN